MRIRSWLLRASTMCKIDGSIVVLFITIHTSSEARFCEPLGRVIVPLKPGTESCQVPTRIIVEA